MTSLAHALPADIGTGNVIEMLRCHERLKGITS